MKPKKPHPTYDSPKGPVKDFLRFLEEADTPLIEGPFQDAVERARQSLREPKR